MFRYTQKHLISNLLLSKDDGCGVVVEYSGRFYSSRRKL